MLLLLLTYQKFHVKDQYEIWQGVTTVRNKENKPGKKQETGYKVINLSGIDGCTSIIDESSLVDYFPAREITKDKLLTPHDYLISCKGEVKGYSMLNSEQILDRKGSKNPYKGIVASNHFLVLRPRMIAGTTIDEIRFLHNLLNIIVAELQNSAASKPGNTKYLTISDVANFEFNFPYKNTSEIKKFQIIHSDYLEKMNELNKVKSKLEKYNNLLAEKILIK